MEGRSDADSFGLGSVATTEIAGALLRALQDSYAAQMQHPPTTTFSLADEKNGCEPAVDWTTTDGSGGPAMILFLQGRVADLLAALAATRRQLTAQSILVLKQQAAIRALEAKTKVEFPDKQAGARSALNEAIDQATAKLQQQLKAKEEVESNLHSQLLRSQGQCATLQSHINRLEIYRDASQMSPSQRSVAHDRQALATFRQDLSELKNRLRAKDVQCNALSAECTSLREILDSALQKAIGTPDSFSSVPKASKPSAKHRKPPKPPTPPNTAASSTTPVVPPVLDNLSFSVMTVAEATPYTAVPGDVIDETVAEFSNGRRNRILFTRINRGVYLYGRMAVRLRYSTSNGELRVVYDKKARSLRHFVQKFEDSEYQQLEAQTTELAKIPDPVIPRRRNSRKLVSCGDLSPLQRDRLSLSPCRLSRGPPSLKRPELASAEPLEDWQEPRMPPLDPNSATGAAQKFIDRLARQREQDQQQNWKQQRTKQWPAAGVPRLSQPQSQVSPRRGQE